MAHPDETTLQRFLDQSLPDAERRAAEAHVADCESCRRTVAALALARSVSSGPTLRSPVVAALQQTPMPERGAHVGRYVVEGELGAGAMGVVYAARDEQLGRRIALKVVRSASAEAKARLLREAQAMAKLSHPNVLTVHEVFAFGGELAIAMEFVEGTTLRQWLTATHAVPEVLALFDGIAAGLEAAHAAGLVHRDLKPDNVLIGRDGRPRVADFGLAADRGAVTADAGASDTGPVDLTRSGALVGTPAYMSPEQFSGGEVDARSDQFSFCVVLHEALFGRRPFDAKSIIGLKEAVTSGARAPVDSQRAKAVPPVVLAAIDRGLSVDAGKRFASMSELRRALVPPRASRWWLAAPGVAAAAAAAIGLAVWMRPSCEQAGSSMKSTWNEASAAQVRQAWASAPAWATGSLERALDGLGRHAQLWVAQARDACEATHIKKEQSADMLDRRTACLDAELADFRAVIAALKAPSPEQYAHAEELIKGLPSPLACSAGRELLDEAPLPADPKRREAIAAARETLAKARALANAGNPLAALTIVEAADRDAAATGYGPLAAEAAYELGKVLSDLGRAVEADAALARALPLAMSARASRVEAGVYIERVHVLGDTLAKAKPALELVPLAKAALSRSGGAAAGFDEPELALAVHEGAVRLGSGDTAGAKTVFDQALVDVKKKEQPEGLLTATVLMNVANVQDVLEDHDGAQKTLLHVIELYEQGFGKDHPKLAMAWANLGTARFGADKLPEAEEAYRRALAIAEATLGKDSVEAAEHADELAVMLASQGKPAEAIPLHERARDTLTKKLGPQHPSVGSAILNLGAVDYEQGNLKAAAERFAQAAAIFEAGIGLGHPWTGSAYRNLARVRRSNGDLEGALAAAQKAIAGDSESLGADSPKAARDTITLADILLDLHRQREALEHLERIAPIFEKAGQPYYQGEALWGAAQCLADLRQDRPRQRELATKAKAAFEVAAKGPPANYRTTPAQYLKQIATFLAKP